MEDEVVDSRHYTQWTRDWIAKEKARLKAAGRSVFMARRMPLQSWQIAAYYGIDSDSDDDHNEANEDGGNQDEEDQPSLNGSSQLNDATENVTSSSNSSDSFGMHTLRAALSSSSSYENEEGTTMTEDSSPEGKNRRKTRTNPNNLSMVLRSGLGSRHPPVYPGTRRYPVRKRRQPEWFQFEDFELNKQKTPKRSRQQKGKIGGGGQKEMKLELKVEEEETAEPEGRKKAKGEKSQKAGGAEGRKKTKGETSQKVQGSNIIGMRNTKAKGTGPEQQQKGTKKAKKTAAEGSSKRKVKTEDEE